MPRIMIQDLQTGQAVEQPFLVHEKELRTTRTGSLYITTELGDRTGRIPARMWDATQQVFDSFQPDDFVRVKGRVETYKGRLQLIVEAIEPSRDAEIDIADFLPATNKDVAAMYARLIEIAKMVKRPGLRKLLASFLKDAQFSARFRKAPAAVRYHHAFLGGLLEHTLGVAEMAVAVAERYPDLDGDMLLTGVILHDIGKIEEFSYDRAFSYSDSGGLLGHLYIGSRMIEERAAGIDELGRSDTEALVHLMLSHHGEYEYQSPKLPMTAEAMTVHFLDNLDAKLNAFRSAMLDDRDPENHWTEWNRMFERRLFKGHDRAD